jgi:hypothetical protein
MVRFAFILCLAVVTGFAVDMPVVQAQSSGTYGGWFPGKGVVRWVANRPNRVARRRAALFPNAAARHGNPYASGGCAGSTSYGSAGSTSYGSAGSVSYYSGGSSGSVSYTPAMKTYEPVIESQEMCEPGNCPNCPQTKAVPKLTAPDKARVLTVALNQRRQRVTADMLLAVNFTPRDKTRIDKPCAALLACM